jgi:hypothetical protein
MAELFDGEGTKQLDSTLDLLGRFSKLPQLLFVGSRGQGRVRDTPMGKDRLAGEDGTGLSGIVANRNNDVEARVFEFIPGFAARGPGVYTLLLLQHADGKGIDVPGGLAPGAVGFEAIPPNLLSEILGENAPGGIACAKKEYLRSVVFEGLGPSADICMSESNSLNIYVKTYVTNHAKVAPNEIQPSQTIRTGSFVSRARRPDAAPAHESHGGGRSLRLLPGGGAEVKPTEDLASSGLSTPGRSRCRETGGQMDALSAFGSAGRPRDGNFRRGAFWAVRRFGHAVRSKPPGKNLLFLNRSCSSETGAQAGKRHGGIALNAGSWNLVKAIRSLRRSLS